MDITKCVGVKSEKGIKRKCDDEEGKEKKKKRRQESVKVARKKGVRAKPGVKKKMGKKRKTPKRLLRLSSNSIRQTRRNISGPFLIN